MASIDLKKIGLTDGARILRYPTDIADSETIGNNQLAQYMLIRISSSKRGSLLAGDEFVVPTAPTPEDGRPSFEKEINKPYNLAGGLSEVDTSIVLPMPANYMVNTSIGYDNNFVPADALKAVDFAMGNSSVWSKMKGVGAMLALGKNGSGGVSGLVNKLTTSVGLGKVSEDQILASQRYAKNPMKEVKFSGMDFRTFTFPFLFSPKNAADSAQLKVLTDVLRYYALPEFAGGRLFYIFPGVFRVQFMIGSDENTWIPKIGASVMTSITLNYSANGTTWSTFSTGAPTFVSMTMNLTEIEIVDRTKVYNSESPLMGGY